MKTIYVVTGQTATGKTDYALELAQKHNGEMINFDARQIYKELDIVTGKDINHGVFNPVETINGFDIGYYSIQLENGSTKIWLYDILTPDKTFSSIEYANLGLHVIKKIVDAGKTPIIVGGTYFYLMHLLYNAPDFDTSINWDKRNELEDKSVEELQKLLQEKNLAAYEGMNNSDRNNPRRLIRRIEVLDTVDPESFTSSQIRKDISLGKKLQIEDIKISITGFYREDRDKTRTVIEKRVLKRIEQGAIDETRHLLTKYLPSSPGLKSIGYPQIIEYLEKHTTKEQLIEDWIKKEYQYAKRQYTFMKTDNNISWKNIP
jgi:tRNA dimethylallyltransferase